jgi:hypothetical protein
MNVAQAQAIYDNSIDLMAEINDSLERKEASIRYGIESDAELLGEAVADYYAGNEHCDLLTEFTLALCGAEKLVDAIAHGDGLPDSELQAFRALCRQIEEAKRRTTIAISEMVEKEMSK